MYDLIIIGGGPAGTTAAVYAARKRLNSLLISIDVGGQVNRTSGVENYMGFQYIEGPELMRRFEEQMKLFPIEMRLGRPVVRLLRKDGFFELTTGDDKAYEAKAVILATGKRSRQLEVPGEERLVGRGISHCAICDGPLFAGKPVAVVGGGNSALEAVNDLTNMASHVYLVSIGLLTADSVLIDRAMASENLTVFTQHQVQEVLGKDRVEGLIIKSVITGESRELHAEGLFIEIGLTPNSDIVKGMVRMNEAGEVMVNCSAGTSVPGLYAAGDVSDIPEKQIIVAAGEGAKAALQAHRYLQRL